MGKQATSARKSQSGRHQTGHDDEEQSKLFLKKAHEIGADDENALQSDKLIGQLAKKPPEPRKPGSK
jgi:hypothetical protein